jgi:hypothetical protein
MEGLTSRVAYLADNCGEIVFDALLVDYLKRNGSHVTFAVRGAPILNDATIDDAVALGLDRRTDVLTATTDGIAELGSTVPSPRRRSPTPWTARRSLSPRAWRTTSRSQTTATSRPWPT